MSEIFGEVSANAQLVVDRYRGCGDPGDLWRTSDSPLRESLSLRPASLFAAGARQGPTRLRPWWPSRIRIFCSGSFRTAIAFIGQDRRSLPH